MRPILRPSLARLAALAAPAALALLAACSSDGPSEPTDAAPLDVGQLLAETSVPTMPGVAAMAPFGATLATPATPASAGCPYDAASRSFVCAPITSGGLTINLAYQLLDAAGRALSTPDRNAAASMRTVSTTAGTITPPAGSGAAGTLTVAHRQEMTLSGLLAGPRRLDGTSTTKLDGSLSLNGVAMPVNSTTTQTVVGLVLPTGAAGAPKWPSAGTVTTEITTAAGPGTPATTARIRMEFDGTSRAALTITVGGLTRRCTVDLANPTSGTALVCTG